MQKGACIIKVKLKSILPVLFALSAATAFLIFSGKTAESVSRSLAICGKLIVPSLFPYMVMSSLLAKTGTADIIGKAFSRPVAYLFKLPPECASAVIMGAVCGFPVGAVTAVDLYAGGKISKDTAERLLPICNNTGPSFIIGVIGNVYWNSPSFGVFLYAAQIIASVTVGVASSLSSPQKTVIADEDKRKARTDDGNLLAQLSQSISTAAVNMLIICGFIVFYAATDLVLPITDALFPSGYVSAIFAACMEFSSGAKLAAAHSSHAFAAAVTTFSIGWAGLSVHSQTAAFAIQRGLSMRRYYKCKFAQGLICAVLSFAYAIKTNISPALTVFTSLPPVIPPRNNMLVTAVYVVFFTSLICYIIQKTLFRKKSQSLYK